LFSHSHIKDCRYVAEKFRGDGHGQQFGQAPRDLCSDARDVQGDDEGTQHIAVFLYFEFDCMFDVIIIGQCAKIDIFAYQIFICHRL
jgi:hypothetical protein